MKIIVAPNAFKGSLTAAQAADAIATGIKRGYSGARVRLYPIADGGDGLLDTLQPALHAQRHTHTVPGPLGTEVHAGFLFCEDRQLAVIEMASAAGLALLDPGELDALHASSEGVGQLMLAALDLGARHIVLGIGGSATTDAGTGLLTALGIRFLDSENRPLTGNGLNLEKIRRIDRSGLDARLSNTRIEVACDVENPLFGETGASKIYAPQKGADPAQVEYLENGLKNLAEVIHQDLGIDVAGLQGGGAAGGMGAGLHAFLSARLTPGAALVLALLNIEQAIKDADLLITGEGRLDAQTQYGKAPGAVAALAKKYQVPCIAIAGALDPGCTQLHDAGFGALFSLCPGPVTLEDAVMNSENYLSDCAEQVIRCLQLTHSMKTTG